MGHGGFEYTWFMNPKPPAYWDAVFLEHGYMRVEANATNIHIIVRTPTPPPRCLSTICDMMQSDVTCKPGWVEWGVKAVVWVVRRV